MPLSTEADQESRRLDTGLSTVQERLLSPKSEFSEMDSMSKFSNQESIELKQKYHKILEERNNLWKENTELKERFSKGEESVSEEKALALLKENQELKREFEKLVKVSQKLEQKAEERKKSLKQLFDILTEKEKELAAIKSGDLKEKAFEKIKQQISIGIETFEKGFVRLQNQLQQKELELSNLEQVVSGLLSSKESFNYGDEQEIDALLQAPLPLAEIVLLLFEFLLVTSST